MGFRPRVHLSECYLYLSPLFLGFYAGPGGGHCPAQGQTSAKLRGEEKTRGQRGGRVLLGGRVREVRVTSHPGTIRGSRNQK